MNEVFLLTFSLNNDDNIGITLKMEGRYACYSC